MGPAVLLRNVVGEAEHALFVGIGPLHRHFDFDQLAAALEMDDLRVQWRANLGEVFDKGADAAFVAEMLATPFPAIIDELYRDSGIEEGQLAQALGEKVKMELDVGKDFATWQEANLGAPAIRCFRALQRL